MNYKNTYSRLIENAQARRSGDDKHHIIPRSLGGNDSSDNLVLLTYKEHYVAHHLLAKIHKCRQMTYAWHLMHNLRKQPITAKVYENLKRDFKACVSATHKGKVLSEETKQKIRDKRALQVFSEETKALWSQQRKGTRIGAKNPMFGKTHSKETIDKMIESRSGINSSRVQGHYITPWGKYLTAGEAAEVHDLNHTSVRRWCRQNNDKTVRRQSYLQCQYLNDLGESVIGKTFKELGFSYEKF